MSTVARLMVSIGADMSEFQKEIRKVHRRVEPLAQSLNKMGNTLTKNVTLPIVAAAGGLLLAANRTAAYADEIDKMSVRTGISRQQLQELKFITDQTGVSFDAVQSVIESFTRRLPSMEKGTSDSAKAIEALGIELRDNEGQLRSMDKIFNETLLSLSRMENTTERNALATQIFGRRFFEIVPLLDAGEKGIKELTARAHELGLVMSDEGIDAAVEYKDMMSELRQEFAAVGRDITMQFIPVLKGTVIPLIRKDIIPLVKNLAGFIGTTAEKFGELTDAQKKTVIGLIAFAAVAGPALKMLSVLVRIAGGLKIAYLALSTVTGALIGIPIAGLAAAEGLGRLLRNTERAKAETQKLYGEFVRLNPELRGFIRSTDEAAKANYGFIRSTDELVRSTGDVTVLYGKYSEKLDELNDRYNELVDGMEPLTGERLREAQALRLQIELLEKELELRRRLTQSVEKMKAESAEVSKAFDGVPKYLEPISAATKELDKDFSNMNANIAQSILRLTDAFEHGAGMFMFWASHGERSAQSFLRAFRDMVTQIIAMELAQVVASAFRSAMQSVPFPFNILAAGAAGAAAATAFQAAVPRFGTGAFVKGDTLAIVGDHPQGEFVIPSPDFAGLVNRLAGGRSEKKLMAEIEMDKFRVWLEDNNRRRFSTI
jgi:hypothetical protein